MTSAIHPWLSMKINWRGYGACCLGEPNLILTQKLAINSQNLMECIYYVTALIKRFSRKKDKCKMFIGLSLVSTVVTVFGAAPLFFF